MASEEVSEERTVVEDADTDSKERSRRGQVENVEATCHVEGLLCETLKYSVQEQRLFCENRLNQKELMMLWTQTQGCAHDVEAAA